MADFHFETKLRLALREAAERELRRGRVDRTAASGRSALRTTRRSLVPAALVLVTLIALIVPVVLLTSGRSQHQPVRQPKVVDRFSLADSLGGAVTADGSLWIDDKGRSQLVRVDPRTHRVTARFPAPGDVSVAPTSGSLWALLTSPANAGGFTASSLIRVGLRTGGVAARIPLRTPSGERFWGFALAAGEEGVWVLGTTPTWHDRGSLGVLRIDPQTGRATTLIALPYGWGPDGIALRGRDLWALAVGSRQQGLLRFDARTGSRLSDVRILLPNGNLRDDPAPGTFGFAGDALIASVHGGFARIDPTTGQVLWRWHRSSGQGVQAWTVAAGMIWAAVQQSGASDRLVEVAPNDGHVLTGVNLDEFGTAGIAAIDNELWVTTTGGTAVIVWR
ncbi:MAG TPA: hypothetical protein VFI54_14310 [Solirubrobacteraceae bacterium]|nr:hypothetical protein [Solirubrobacteraceae bacterium]